MTVQIYKNVRKNTWIAARETRNAGTIKVAENKEKAQLTEFLDKIGAKVEQ